MVAIDVYLETGEKRVFVSAVDWPGWSRGGKTADEALALLLATAPRYAGVAKRAGHSFPKAIDGFEVVSRLKGDASTDFGIPGRPAPSDGEKLTPEGFKRWRSLLQAAWATWDASAAAARDVTLTLGPRGGGRSLDKMTHHVFEAEQAYLRQLGSKPPSGEGMGELRAASLKALSARVKSEAPPNPNKVKKLWSPRYYVRRAAWHVLDHAWEVEDRSRRDGN